MFYVNTLPTYDEAVAAGERFKSAPTSNSASNIIFNAGASNSVISGSSGSAITVTMSDSNPMKQESAIVQSNFVSTTPMSESLQQISTNTLPPYSPGPFPSFFKDDPCQTFSCSACGDTFVLQSSLNFHMQRRAVLIRFNCDSCPSVQAFYNRCSLLSHVRAHADKQEPSDISKALVLPLPRVLMEGIQTDMVQTLDEEDDDSRPDSPQDNEVPIPSKMLEVSISEGEAVSTSVTHYLTRKEKEILKNVQCSECDAVFTSTDERFDHFTNKEKLPAVINPCQKCGIICPSECSTKAHKRLHLQISPYVCPECGDNPDRYWENFQRHLTFQCFHYARTLSYKCTVCTQLFKSSEAVKQHAVSNHTIILYKCQICPMAFTSYTHFQVHKTKTHAAEIQSGDLTDPLQIYKCSVCYIVFIGKEESDKHWDSHMKESICQYAFVCSECSEVLNSKVSLCNHLKKAHVELYNKNVPFLNVPHEINSLSASGKNVGLNKTRMECLLCHAAFMTRQGHSLHVTKSHSNPKYPCGVCNKSLTNRVSMISHGREHLREDVSLCLLCQNKPMKPPETLDHHLLYHVERVKYQTFCPMCEIALFTFDEALQHLRLEHLLLPTTVQRELTVQPESSCHTYKEKHPLAKSQPNLQSGVKNISNSVITEKKRVDSSKCQMEAHSYEERMQTGENFCGKCDFKTMDRAEFKQHILTHKANRSTYQCLECGICYIVEPSLKKHLIISHRIKQPEVYIAQEGANYFPESETVPETVKSNALECTVCFEVFASETLLKTHMRSHGMAFIQQKMNLGN